MQDNTIEERVDIILENEQNINLKIGDKAPEFIAQTTFGETKLIDYKGKWVILFSHPRRFYTSLYYRISCFCKNVSRV